MTAEAALAAWVAQTCAAVRVEVAWLGIAPERLAPGGTPHWSGDPCQAHPALELTWRTDAGVDRMTVRPELAIWVSGPVATAPVSPGEPIPWHPGEIPLAALAGGVWTGGDPLAIRPIRAGEALTRANTREAPDLPAGSAVTLRVRVGDLEVRAVGALLDPGTFGEPVRVVNHATHAIVRGRLVGPDTVELGELP